MDYRLRQLDKKPESRFEPFRSFEFVVPFDYVHKKRLARFYEANNSRFNFYHPGITDESYNASHCLIPGARYKANIFAIKGGNSSEYCIHFMKLQKSLFINAPGLSLLWEQKRDLLPQGWLVGFDEEISFLSGEVPCLCKDSEGNWDFSESPYDTEDWSPICYLVCVYLII